MIDREAILSCYDCKEPMAPVALARVSARVAGVLFAVDGCGLPGVLALCTMAKQMGRVVDERTTTTAAGD